MEKITQAAGLGKSTFYNFFLLQGGASSLISWNISGTVSSSTLSRS
ncbi:MAG: hypothetical protein V8R55_12490 [Dysosmobacter sp.]